MNWVIYWFRLWLNYRLKATKPLSKLILDNSTYRKISWNQEAVRLVIRDFALSWNLTCLTDGSATSPPFIQQYRRRIRFFININITALKFHEIFLFYHLGWAHRICMGQRNVTKFLLQYALSPKSFGAQVLYSASGLKHMFRISITGLKYTVCGSYFDINFC